MYERLAILFNRLILVIIGYLYDKWAEARDHCPAGTIGRREKNQVDHLYLDI